MRIYNDISEQQNTKPANAQYYAPVDGEMIFQIPCEVYEVQIVDIADDSFVGIPIADFSYSFGTNGDGELVTNILIDSNDISPSPFYISFACNSGDFYHTDQFCKVGPICPKVVKLEAVRGCEFDFNGIWHGPLGDAIGTMPDLVYTHCLWLGGELDLPSWEIKHEYSGSCDTHISSKTTQSRRLHAFNIAPWYAQELVNLLGAKALLIDGQPFRAQDLKVQPEKGTCLYHIDQEIVEKSQTFYAACLAQCYLLSCDDKIALVQSAGFFLNFDNVAGVLTVTFNSTNYDDQLTGYNVTVTNQNGGPVASFPLSADPYIMYVGQSGDIDPQTFLFTYNLGEDCETCTSLVIVPEMQGDYPVDGECEFCIEPDFQIKKNPNISPILFEDSQGNLGGDRLFFSGNIVSLLAAGTNIGGVVVARIESPAGPIYPSIWYFRPTSVVYYTDLLGNTQQIINKLQYRGRDLSGSQSGELSFVDFKLPADFVAFTSYEVNWNYCGCMRLFYSGATPTDPNCQGNSQATITVNNETPFVQTFPFSDNGFFEYWALVDDGIQLSYSSSITGGQCGNLQRQDDIVCVTKEQIENEEVGN